MGSGTTRQLNYDTILLFIKFIDGHVIVLQNQGGFGVYEVQFVNIIGLRKILITNGHVKHRICKTMFL